MLHVKLQKAVNFPIYQCLLTKSGKYIQMVKFKSMFFYFILQSLKLSLFVKQQQKYINYYEDNICYVLPLCIIGKKVDLPSLDT